MSRTDPHRPSEIKPENYRFLAFYATVPGCPELQAHIMSTHRHAVQKHLDKGGKGFAKNHSQGMCYCCGSYHKQGITCVYLPTQELVQFGHTCGEHVEGMNEAAFRRFTKTAAEARERAAGYAKFEVTLKDQGIEGLYEWFRASERDGIDDSELDFYHHKMITLLDMCRKMVKYGSMSEKAWNYMLKCWAWTQEAPAKRAERKARQEAEKANMVEIEPGRRFIEGEIVSVKWYDGAYGEVKKILVACDGFKVWTSCPNAISSAGKGARVTFNVTLEPKERGFAIGKRPAKATIL